MNPRHLVLVLFLGWTLACGRPEGRTFDRATLVEVPQPVLDSYNEDIQRQLQEERARMDEEVEQGTDAESGEAFGRMAQLYHAYGLLDEARLAYQNAQALVPDEARWWYLAGVIAQTRGEVEAATTHFENVVEQWPEDRPALLRLAEMRLSAKRSEEAAEIFERVVSLDPRNAAAHAGLGRVASGQEDFAAAIAAFDRALELQPEARNLHYLLGVAHRRLGNREEAERHIASMNSNEVIFEDPLVEGLDDLLTGVGPLLDQALQDYGAKRYDEAVEGYRKALEQDPKNATALRGLGFTLHEAGRLEESAVALANMVEVYPDHTLARLELATVLMEKGDLAEAETEFQRVIEQDPTFEQARFNLGVTLSRMGRWEEAAESFARVVELDERDVNARFHLAMALDELGRQEATAELRRVLAEDPSHIKARQRLGLALLNSGNLEDAYREHQAVVDLEKAPPQEKALAHYQQGKIRKQQGREDEAIGHFREATVLFPELWQAGVALANTHRDAGRPGAAAAEYRRVVEADPGNLLARRSEVDLMISAGRHRDARQRLEEGLAALPRSAELAHLLARHLATVPVAELRDGRRALELAQSLHQALPNLDHAETVGMALAATGRFRDAVAWQEDLLSKVPPEDAERLDRLRRHLRLYQRGESVR